MSIVSGYLQKIRKDQIKPDLSTNASKKSTHQRNKPQKTKLIHKHSKNQKNTQIEIQAQTNTERAQAQKIIQNMLKDIMGKSGYQRDTYLGALKILKEIIINNEIQACKLKAATICSIIGKVHEYRTPRHQDLVYWSNNAFTQEQLVREESIVLIELRFSVPMMTEFQTVDELQASIDQHEIKMLCL